MSRVFSLSALVILSVVVLAAVGIGLARPESGSAQAVGGPPAGCGDGCEYMGERSMNYALCGDDREGIGYKLTRTGPEEFSALVCLYDYQGQAVACNRDSGCDFDEVGQHRHVPPGEESKIWEIVGPEGVNIWKVRWFNCGGEGNVTLEGEPYCSDGCLDYGDCTSQLNPVCEPEQCDEQFLGSVWRPDPPWAYPCEDPGHETVQVSIRNDCAYPQALHYWWTYEADGIRRTEGIDGITLPGGGAYTHLCRSFPVVQQEDGFVTLDGYVRGVNGCEPAYQSIIGFLNRQWCCDEDLNCTEEYNDPLVPDGACVPPSAP